MDHYASPLVLSFSLGFAPDFRLYLLYSTIKNNNYKNFKYSYEVQENFLELGY